MNIALLCATDRGYQVFQKLLEIKKPEHELSVFSFREEPHEPPFLSKIEALAKLSSSRFTEAKSITPKLLSNIDHPPIDILLAVSWRYMVPRTVFGEAKIGAFVFHDSLLPKYRGFSPTVWAIANGESETGVTLFEMADDVDSGAIVAQKAIHIDPDETITSVLPRVTQAYLDILSDTFESLVNSNYQPVRQIESDATYCCKRVLEDNKLDWSKSANCLYNLIRAVTRPYPGAYTFLGDQKVTVWSANHSVLCRKYVGKVPGRIVEIIPGMGAVVLTGDSGILLKEVQVEGEEPTTADKVFNSLGMTAGR